MVSSSDPGRCVGLMSPIVPRQLVNATAPSLKSTMYRL
jgi:hypothetical protein